jgi:hypothetical protein
VNAETVDLKALAIYVRLIDLLDLADDRTPFVIWQFVSPRNPRSVMAWNKHRALNPATFPGYQGNRKILVDGSTNDPEIWAELQDLARYVEEQVRGCNDLLARLPDRRCHLDLPVVEWRVHAEGFIPLDIRFEFNRERTFQILSDEIYDGDCYVFLRELLQNSIDAIRMRKELLQRDGVTIEGLIRFDVNHDKDGNARVDCHDNGIGMDDYIVRHYLAVAGRSFYTSDDFKNYGLQMDAISRFGIGILSCFMAADEIEIRTLRDPAISGKREPIRIHIPEIGRQFRIYSETLAMRPGTTVTVYVKNRHLADAAVGWNGRLRAADYLAKLGGFIPFPVLVVEDGTATAILHPDENAKTIGHRLSESGEVLANQNIAISKKGHAYPWETIFAPQDLIVAQELFELRWLTIGELWGDNPCPYEGRIAILNPRDPSVYWHCRRHRMHESYRELKVLITSDGVKSTIRTLRWRDAGALAQGASEAAVPPSANHHTLSEIHYNGILVGNQSLRNDLPRTSLPELYFVVNVKKTLGAVLNVSRSDVRKGEAPWRDEIVSRLEDKILAENAEAIAKPDLNDRFRRMGQIQSRYGISIQRFSNVIDRNDWPIVVLCSDSDLKFSTIREYTSKRTPITPSALTYQAIHWLRHYLEPAYAPTGSWLSRWRGEPFVITNPTVMDYTDDYVEGGLRFGTQAVTTGYPVRRIRFLRGWRSDTDILTQVVVDNADRASPTVPAELVGRVLQGDRSLTVVEWNVLFELYAFAGAWGEYGFFESPYDSYAACGLLALNCSHPLIQALLAAHLAISWSESARSLPAAKRGHLQDAYRSLIGEFTEYDGYGHNGIGAKLAVLFEELIHLDLLKNWQIPANPTTDDLVPDSIIQGSKGPELMYPQDWSDLPPTAEFGQVIT